MEPRRPRGPRRRRPHLDPLAGARLLIADEATTPAAASRERFEAAAAPGLHAGGDTEQDSVLEALAHAPVEGIGEVPYGSNAVFLLQLGAADPQIPAEPMRAVYKPARGERPLWDFPRHTLYLREVATFLVDDALRLGRVPPTTLRDGPFGPGSVQLFVHAAGDRPSAAESEILEAQLHDVAMLDVLVNNADRKRSHLMVTHGVRIAAIDNALTFLPYPRQRTALISLGGDRVPEAAVAHLHELRADVASFDNLLLRLRRLLSTGEVDAFAHRVRELADDPFYPELDDWDGRPFEWW